MVNLEKIIQLESELRRQHIDVMLVLSREDSDTVLPLLLPVHVVAQTAIFFCSNGKHVVVTGSTDANMYKEFGIFEIVTVNESFESEIKQVIDRLAPKKMALNISENDYLVDGLTVGQYQLLQEVVGVEELEQIECSSESIMVKIRSIKTEYEQQCIRTAVHITCEIYREVAQLIRVGMSETDIGELFVQGMHRHGVINAFGAPFSYPLICINRCGLAHREPNPNNILQHHDILICDFSVSYKGYCSDIARSFYVLGPNEKIAPTEVLKAFETTVAAVTAVIDGMKVGMLGYEVDALGRSVVEEAGYPTIRHSVGHQLGMRVHDGGTSLSPITNPSSAKSIEIGEVYAIEPTVIQDDGLPSFIVEEDVIIGESSIEILSDRQRSLLYIQG